MSSASLEMHHWTVMFTVGSFSSLPPPGGWYTCRYSDRFSSSPQLAETWSRMTLPTGLPPSASSRLAMSVSLRRKRRWRITTSWVSTQTVAPRTQTPSPGAVCPATVMYGARMRTRFFRRMVPATLKTTTRGPTALHAARKVPGPASARLVTT